MTIEESTARILAAKAKLDEFRLGGWLRSEPGMLPAWKRRPRSFHTLPTGEVIVYGPGRTHTVREVQAKTMYLRRDYTRADVGYLERVLAAPDTITALNAYRANNGRLLRAKRNPIEAEPDPCCPEWCDRPQRTLTAEQMIREQFTGRALQRELRRIK
jgi:hypothetical protein